MPILDLIEIFRVEMPIFRPQYQHSAPMTRPNTSITCPSQTAMLRQNDPSSMVESPVAQGAPRIGREGSTIRVASFSLPGNI
jgi:hypothetical protein